MRWIIGVVLLGFALACGGASVDAATALSPNCQAAEGIAPGVALVALSGPVVPPMVAVHVEVGPETLTIDDDEVTDVAALEAALEAKAATAKDIAAKVGGDVTFRGELLISSDGQLPAADLVPILRAAHAWSFPHIHFVGRSTTDRPSPDYVDSAYGEELSAKVADLDAPERQVLLATELTELLRLCPPASNVFSAVANASAEAKCDLLLVGLDEALPWCPFTDADRVLTGFQVMSHPPTPPLTTLAFDLDPHADPFVIEPGATWGEVAMDLQSKGLASGWWALPDDEG